jgi:ABC transporter, phosphonate, periplasmic substrate-binding protein
MVWKCEGKKLDGMLAFDGKHESIEVSGERCPVCNLTRSEVSGMVFPDREDPDSQLGEKVPLWALAIPVLLLVMGGIGLGIQKWKGGATDNPMAQQVQASSDCPFPNCTVKIGAVNFRPTNSQSPSPSASSNDNNATTTTTQKPACADDATNQSSPNSTQRSPIDRQKFRQYLETELQKQFPAIKVELDDSLDFTQPTWVAAADEKIANKEWDIAFTVSPLVAATAKEQGYEFAYAANIRGQSSFTSAIFVRKDSNITSLGKITPEKVVALGNQSDLVGFYLPIYDLYGTKPKLKPNNSGAKIRSMVLCKEVDVGVSQVRSIKDNPNLTILSSNSVKAGGIYFSPKLTPTAKKILTTIFSATTTELQANAGFRQDAEPTAAEYERVKQVRLRAQEIIKTGAFLSSSDEIVGQIENIRHVNDREYSLGIRTQNDIQYRAIVPDSILQSLSSNPLVDLPRKTIKVVGVKADKSHVLTIGQKEQIVVQ